MFILVVSLIAMVFEAGAASGRIKKVLPHYLDQQGRHMLAPSLYERDAYQAHLRRNPAEISALRFDVHWKALGATSANLKLRLELRGGDTNPSSPVVIESAVKPTAFLSKWSSVLLKREEYDRLGGLIAWRATLWDGEQLLAEQKSFLW